MLLSHLAAHRITEDEGECTNGRRLICALGAAGVSSLDDFVGFVSSKEFEEDWKPFCIFGAKPEATVEGVVVPAVEGALDRQLWARVKSAWKTAHQNSENARTAVVSESAEDLDAVLPVATSDSLQSLWTKRYSMALKVELRPSDALIGRLTARSGANAQQSSA